MNLSFGDSKTKRGPRTLFLDGQLVRGATAQVYEADRLTPTFRVATFKSQSINQIGPFSVGELFAHLNSFIVDIARTIPPKQSWRFDNLLVDSNITRKAEDCDVWVRVEMNIERWEGPYSIRELAESIHLALNYVAGSYWFQSIEPKSLLGGFGIGIRFPLSATVAEILSKVLPDLDQIAEISFEMLRQGFLANVESMQSTFISYGGPDEPFARRVYDALKRMGVTVFFFPETARLGERIDSEVFKQLQQHDRVLLICSKNSLTRPGVVHEIRETFDREARDGGASYILPITLDDYVFGEFREFQPEIAERLCRRIIGNFKGTDSDQAAFDAAMLRVADAIKKESPSQI